MSSTNQRSVGSLGMFGAAVIWGTWVLVLNGVTLPGFFVTAITSFTGFLGLFIYIILTNKNKKLFLILKNPKLLKIIALIAVLEAIQNALFMVAFSLAIKDGGSVFIPVIRSLIGVVTPILAIFLIKKEFFIKYIVLGSISTIGAVIIFTWGGIIADNRISFVGLGMVLLSVFIWSIQNIAQRTMAIIMIDAKQTEHTVIATQVLLTALFLSPLLVWFLVVNQLGVFNTDLLNQFLFIGIFGITHVSIAFILRLNALRNITAQQAVIIGYLEPVTSVALSIVFLNESINTGFVIGAILILGSAIAAGLYSNKK